MALPWSWQPVTSLTPVPFATRMRLAQGNLRALCLSAEQVSDCNSPGGVVAFTGNAAAPDGTSGSGF